MPPPAIDLTGVSRRFGDVEAVADLDLTVPAGSVTVLLGPNGAGKTTTVRLVTGALAPDSGTVRVHGLDPAVAGAEVRRRCGVVPPKSAMYDTLTGRENLVFAAAVFDAESAAIEPMAERFGVAGILDQRVSGYSTGMRTRLALARAFLHGPDILLLDEPTAGLDPEASRAVLDLITEVASSGRTIVLCTHLLHEAEGVADQIVLMANGSARVTGRPADLAARYLTGHTVVLDAEDRALLDAATDHPSVVAARWNGVLEVDLAAIEALPDLVRHLVIAGVRLTRVEPRTVTLADLYFEMQRIQRPEPR